MFNFPLQNDAETIINNIRTQKIKPIDVPTEQRRDCVLYLWLANDSISNMAVLFEVSRTTIYSDIEFNGKKVTNTIKDSGVNTIISEFVKQSEMLRKHAIESKNYFLAWKIVCETIDKLQSLGVVYKQPIKIEHEHSEKTTIPEIRDRFRNRLSELWSVQSYNPN